MANIVSGGIFVKQHKVSSTVVGTGALAGFVFPEVFVNLVDTIFPMFHNLAYSESFFFL